MRRFLVLLFVVFFSLQLNAQGRLTINFKVIDTELKPISGMKIELKEISTRKKITEYTDAEGKIELVLTEGEGWWMSVGKMHKYQYLEMPESGIAFKGEMITYDLERRKLNTRDLPDRSKINFTKKTTNKKDGDIPPPGKILLVLKISKADKRPLRNYGVKLVNLEQKTIVEAETDSKGAAYFEVDFKQTYEIDIDGIESFKSIKTSNKRNIRTYSFTYQPADFKETVTGNTIEQKLPEDIESSSSHLLYTVSVKDSNGNMLAGENIYLDVINSKKTYKATTDQNGTAVFMLPVRRKYMLNFEYQKDVDVINLLYVRGIGKGNMTCTYKPNPRLQYPEKFIPTSELLLVSNFRNFLSKQYPEPEEEKPFRLILNWGNELVNGKTKEAVLELGFSVSSKKSEKLGPPANLCFVVDVSGSMAGYDRLDALKISLAAFIENLRPDDHAALISFNSVPEMLIESGKLLNRKTVFAEETEKLEAGGMTNIYKAMILGYRELEKNKLPEGTNRMILLTDGYGETEIDTVINLAEEYRAKEISISAVGVGEYYNQALLKLLTQNGGIFHHASHAPDIREKFTQEMNGIIYPVAKDVKIEILYNDAIVFKQLYGFPFKNHPDKNKAEMDLLQVYPGLNDLALVKFDLNRPTKSIEKKPVIVRMTYYNYQTGKTEQIEEKRYLKWEENKQSYELIVEAEQKKLYAIAVMNQSLKRMADAFSRDDYEKAENAVNRCIEQIEELYPDAKQADVDELYKQLKEYSEILKQYRKNKIKRSGF